MGVFWYNQPVSVQNWHIAGTIQGRVLFQFFPLKSAGTIKGRIQIKGGYYWRFYGTSHFNLKMSLNIFTGFQYQVILIGLIFSEERHEFFF